MKNYEDDVLVFTEDISILKLALLTNFDVVSYIEDDIQDMVRWRFLDNEEAIELINAYSRVQEEIYDIESLTESELTNNIHKKIILTIAIVLGVSQFVKAQI